MASDATAENTRRDERYAEVATTYGAALERLARGYEANADRRRDLLQEIHVALWRSLAVFDGRCSLRTWVYRVAHNVGSSHAQRDRRTNATKWVSLAELETRASSDDAETAVGERQTLERLTALIQCLAPVERQVILLYLEGLEAAVIGEVTGLSPANVATKVHRIKGVLARRFEEGERHV